VGATDADRQRRFRERRKRHEQGDHSHCVAGKCDRLDAVTRDVTAVTLPVDGLRLDSAGRRLWEELGGEGETAGRRVLILQACRIADRLDALDRLLAGDARDWLEIVETKGNPERQELVIDKALAEERGQATTLKQLIAELRQSGGTEQQDQGGDILDQLAARRAARLANAAGS
jgi:hypothetical protein